MSGEDTEKTVVQDFIVETLQAVRQDLSEIKDRLDSLEKRQHRVEDRLQRLSVDLNTLYMFQRTFTERLSAVEAFCVEQPLKSAPRSD